jgi:hypothetical protein
MAKRDHIPALRGKRLVTALRAIERLPINRGARDALQQMLAEAALPDRHDPQRLGGERAELIRQAQEELHELTQTTLSRARAQLFEIPDDEWERLVEEANRQDEER